MDNGTIKQTEKDANHPVFFFISFRKINNLFLKYMIDVAAAILLIIFAILRFHLFQTDKIYVINYTTSMFSFRIYSKETFPEIKGRYKNYYTFCIPDYGITEY